MIKIVFLQKKSLDETSSKGLQKRKGKKFGKSKEFLFFRSCRHHVIFHSYDSMFVYMMRSSKRYTKLEKEILQERHLKRMRSK